MPPDMLHALDPRAPPGMAEKEMKIADSRRRKESLTFQGKKMLNAASKREHCLPLFVFAATILILSALIFVLGDHRSTSNHLHRPETDELAKMDDPIERCHLTDDYTVRDGKAVLRYNRRSQREEECSHLASERSKVVAAVSDCPFLISVYDKVDGADVDIVSSGIRTSGFWEPRETGMIADLPQGSLVVDIGANIGWHTLVALSLGHTVIAFEPMVGNLGLLEHSLCLNPGLDSKLTLHRTALSDSDKGECHIEADADNIGDGTLWCGARESHGWQTGIFEEHAVALSTLDQKILPGTEIDLIKIDVEGHEMAVVKGGADLFSGKGGHIKPRYVMTEFCPDLIVQQGYDPSELLKFFLTRGYKASFYSGRPLKGSTEAGWAPGQATGSHRADVALSLGGIRDFVRDVGFGSVEVEFSLKA